MSEKQRERPRLVDLEVGDVSDVKGDAVGGTRRKDIDHVGLYNFTVEISGISVAR